VTTGERFVNHCDECGFTYDDVAVTDLAARILGDVAPYRALVLEADGAGVPRQRPAPEVWSPLEYACHMRDVLVVQRERLQLALDEERPEFASMRPDERAVEEDYQGQDPAFVLDELDVAATAFAERLATLEAGDWDRTGVYGFAGPAERAVAWIGRHTLHEVVHHLMDIRRGIEQSGG